MASFSTEEMNDLDYQILQNTSVSLYLNHHFLEDDLIWLKDHRYLSHQLDAAGWTDESAMHESIRDALSFPAYYGKNLDALRDCMWNLAVPQHGGLVVVLTSYDVFANGPGSSRLLSKATLAEALLDVLAEASRRFLLTGRRLLTFLQSNDPLLRFENLGGVDTQWNRREWLNRERGL